MVNSKTLTIKVVSPLCPSCVLRQLSRFSSYLYTCTYNIIHVSVNWEYFVLRSIGWVWLKCPVSGIVRCPLLRGLNSIAINEERSVPEGNVLINERSAFQGVRKSRFHCSLNLILDVVSNTEQLWRSF